MYISESALKNKTHKLLWTFENQTNIGQTTTVIVNTKKEKEILSNGRLCCLGRQQSKNQKKAKSDIKYLDLARELKKNTLKHEGDGDTNYN